MISISQAEDLIEEHCPSRQSTYLPISSCSNRITTEDITARQDSPTATNSAMDGFAIRKTDLDTTENRQQILKITGESRAGAPFHGNIPSGNCIRINTGALLPSNLDTVIPIENILKEENGNIFIQSNLSKNDYLRRQGEEFKQGDLLLPSGTKLYPTHIALLASQGITEVSVYTGPRISILTSGDELIPFHQSAASHQVRDTNSIMLLTAIETLGGIPAISNSTSDTLNKTVEVIKSSATECSILITCGGVSVGPHDYIREAAGLAGFKEVFWRVKQKPGKPLLFAKKDNSLLFGLPGNPVSAYMCFIHYVKPLLRYLLGEPLGRPFIQAELSENITNHLERSHMCRVRLEKQTDSIPAAHPLNNQASHKLLSILEADGYFIINSGQELQQGTFINVHPFQEDQQ